MKKGNLALNGAQDLTFINSGNRDIAVTGVSLVLYKLKSPPTVNAKCDEVSNVQVPTLNMVYDFQSFVLEPGDISVHKFKQTLFPQFWKDDSVDNNIKDFILGKSIFGKGDVILSCLRLSVTTPGIVTDHAMIPKHYVAVTNIPHNGPASSAVNFLSDSSKPYTVIHSTTTSLGD
jgi:hypothetical protein